MKIIDLDNSAFEAMTGAPIDEKNICSDFLLDDIYDNQLYVENGKTFSWFCQWLSDIDRLQGLFYGYLFQLAIFHC